MTNTDEAKLRKRAEKAPQPGPWKAIEGPDGEWRVVDAHGMWVCDVGRDKLDAQFIAAAHPQAVIALLDTIAKLRADAQEQATRTCAAFDYIEQNQGDTQVLQDAMQIDIGNVNLDGSRKA
jgi:hypothetical protein